jgi:hypothetical protein
MVLTLGRSRGRKTVGTPRPSPEARTSVLSASSEHNFQHIYPVSELRDSFRLNAIMSDERKQLEERSKLLRQQLKVWEKQFGQANSGKRPARQDIKANPDIGRLLINNFL